MAKTSQTLEMECAIWRHTKKTGVFGCFEVTVGNMGRADYLTLDTKGAWRCYEIKVSKQDFHSDAALTFVGNYNYYVLPEELYRQVSGEIPHFIGVYTENGIAKPSTRRELTVPVDMLYLSMIRSMARDVDEAADTRGENITYFEKIRKKLGERQRQMRWELHELRERVASLYKVMESYQLKNAELRQKLRNVTNNSAAGGASGSKAPPTIPDAVGATDTVEAGYATETGRYTPVGIAKIAEGVAELVNQTGGAEEAVPATSAPKVRTKNEIEAMLYDRWPPLHDYNQGYCDALRWVLGEQP